MNLQFSGYSVARMLTKAPMERIYPTYSGRHSMIMRKLKGIGGIIMIVPFVALVSAGCEGTIDKEGQDAVATAYADILLAESMNAADSVAAGKAVDSILAHHGFADREELNADMKRATEQPEMIRSILDSAQRRLQRIQQGTEDTAQTGARVKPWNARKQVP